MQSAIREKKRGNRMAQSKRQVITIRRVPLQLKDFLDNPPVPLPTPIQDLLIAIRDGTLKEMVLVGADNATRDRLKAWYEG